MTQKAQRPGIPTRDQLYKKHCAGRDPDAFARYVAEIEERAVAEGKGRVADAYGWLFKSNRVLIQEMGAFSPGFLDFASAMQYVSEALYWEAVASPMDPSLLDQYMALYRQLAFSDGRDTRAAVEWLSTNMISIGHQNIEVHPDWPERNHSYGALHKQLAMGLMFPPQPDHGRAPDPLRSAPRDPTRGSRNQLHEAVLAAISRSPGATDRQITDEVIGRGRPQQSVNALCRTFVRMGVIARQKRPDGLIGNYPRDSLYSQPASHDTSQVPPPGLQHKLSEDSLKAFIRNWLTASGWTVRVVWGKRPGIDIEAVRGDEVWRIEVKGSGSRPQMRVNYFLAVLGELLQRMDDPAHKYSVAFPDLPQFRSLWNRLPAYAKARLKITALFVASDGRVIEGP